MFDIRFSFDGSFQPGCQKKLGPPSLFALVNMILDGVNIKYQTDRAGVNNHHISALAISQLLMFNGVTQCRGIITSPPQQAGETSFTLYLSMQIDVTTRSARAGLTHVTFWICVFDMTSCYNSHGTLQMVSDNASVWKALVSTKVTPISPHSSSNGQNR